MATRKRMKRANGTGTIKHRTGKNGQKLRKPYYAYGPAIRVFDEKTKTFKLIQPLVGSFETYRAAAEALDESLQDPYDPEKERTYEDIYNEWIEEHIRIKRIKESWERTIRSCWRKHLLSQLGDHRIKNTTFDELQDVVYSCESPSQQKNMIQIITGINTYAVKRKWVPQNLGELLEHDPIDHRKRVPFTLEEIARVKELVEENKTNHKFQNRGPDMILLMLYSGLRIDEACRMQLANIHLNDGYMIGGNKTKAGIGRTIPIHPEAKEALERLIAASKSEIKNGKLWKDTGADLFRRTYFNKLFPNHRPHDTRVTFTTWWRAQQLSEHALKAIIGHAPTSVTDHYTKLPRSVLIAEMRKFEYRPIEE